LAFPLEIMPQNIIDPQVVGTGVGQALTIDLSEIHKATKNIDQQKVKKIFSYHITAGMRGSLAISEGAIASFTPVNQGILRHSITHEIRGIPPRTDITGDVFTPLVYGVVVERGRKPGRRSPPVRAIELWVVRKGFVPRHKARDVAYVIARAIGAKGTKPEKMFAKGFDVSLPTVVNIFQARLDRVVAELSQVISK
jgi:hypothetical protein